MGRHYGPEAEENEDMLHAVVLLVAGLAAGFAIASWLEPREDAGREIATAATSPMKHEDAAADARLDSLAETLAFESEQRAVLEDRVDALAAELAALRSGTSEATTAATATETAEAVPTESRARVRRDAAALREDGQRRVIEALVAAGFPPDRAEWINRRTQELRMESLQAQYDARREGRPFEPSAAFEGARTLRDELGDADYERYLAALGRPTSVAVRDVLASSPAERVGLKSGDEVVAYDGKRVFDARELNSLTLAGNAGESVLVDVRRDGQMLQLVMPRGPLGILGGFRGPPR
jgi:hypothetical protein